MYCGEPVGQTSPHMYYDNPVGASLLAKRAAQSTWMLSDLT
ncbi:hypothetical protein SAMN04487858_102199, partial [Pseudomonas sp. ok602]